MEEIRICKIHGDSIFKLRTDKVWQCKKCASEATSKSRQLLKQKAIEYKGGKCIVCGYNKCNRALEFHHLDPTQKDFGIGGKRGVIRSWNKIKNELDKCILVCGNCHSEIHDNLIDLTNILKTN